LKLTDDSKKNSTILEIALPEGEKCKSDPSKNYQIIYEIICDQNANSTRIDSKIPFNSDSCINKVTFFSNAGCPKMNIYSIFNLLIDNNYVFGIVLMSLGIFFCFLGNYFFFPLSLMAGVIFVSFLALFLIFSNINVSLTNLLFWLIILLVIIFGLIFGYFLTNYETIVDIIIGGASGYSIGVILYNFILNRINSNPKVVFWVTISTSIALKIFLVFFFKNFVIISGTSFIGSYGIIRVLFLIMILQLDLY